MFQIVGRTTDGRNVVTGVYRFFETHGLPLDVVLEILYKRDCIPDWAAFRREALLAGMKHSRIVARLHECISDVYGVEMRDEVVRRLDAFQAAGRLHGEA